MTDPARADVDELLDALMSGAVAAEFVYQRDGSRLWSWREGERRLHLAVSAEGEIEFSDTDAVGAGRVELHHPDGSVTVVERTAAEVRVASEGDGPRG